MANIVARIRLANGETGYYDDQSGIFLNWAHPEADVTDDMDLSGLRTSHRCHRIKVLSGSLGKAKTFKHILAEAKAKRLGVPVEHILHHGKKRAVYETEAPEAEEKPVVKESPKKTENPAPEQKKEAPKTEEKPAEKAEEKKASAKKPAAKRTAKKSAKAGTEEKKTTNKAEK